MLSSMLRWVVCLLALIILPSCGEPKTAATAVQEFGISKSKPIDLGFSFFEGTYVDAPYVVERRGLDIYINDIRVSKGSEWPTYDYSVAEDPGDPPPGCYPFNPPPPGVDRRDTYWPRKWRYLHSHYDLETAQQKMIETYRKSDTIRKVEYLGYGQVLIENSSGGKIEVDLFPPPVPRLTAEETRGYAEEAKASYENVLKGDVALFRFEGGELIFPSDGTAEVLEILLSDVGKEKKIKALGQLTGRPEDEWIQGIVAGYQPNPQLAERYQKLKEVCAKN